MPDPKLTGWTCEGQTDLTEITGTEHIAGSMPADEDEMDAERERFYEVMRERRGRAYRGD